MGLSACVFIVATERRAELTAVSVLDLAFFMVGMADFVWNISKERAVFVVFGAFVVVVVLAQEGVTLGVGRVTYLRFRVVECWVRRWVAVLLMSMK